MALERLELLSEHGCFGGVQRFYKHFSVNQIGLPMRFALFLPPQALAGQKVPLLTYLAGLTCTEETATMKAGAQRLADFGLQHRPHVFGAAADQARGAVVGEFVAVQQQEVHAPALTG